MSEEIKWNTVEINNKIEKITKVVDNLKSCTLKVDYSTNSTTFRDVEDAEEMINNDFSKLFVKIGTGIEKSINNLKTASKEFEKLDASIAKSIKKEATKRKGF